MLKLENCSVFPVKVPLADTVRVVPEVTDDVVTFVLGTTTGCEEPAADVVLSAAFLLATAIVGSSCLHCSSTSTQLLFDV